ncbi:MAG: hypothetical protein GEV10_18345 [Streptosporangiales bacterium]|nr:hypothetical protein [Streptosporangiales bacterium]
MANAFAGVPGPRIALASSALDDLSVIVVTEDGQVLRYRWQEQEWPDPGLRFGPFPLRGVTAIGSPAAISGAEGRLDVFVRTDRHELAWGAVDADGAFSGWTVLARYLAFDPVAVSNTPGRVDVFAPSVTGPLRQWTHDGATWQTERIHEWGCGTPAVITSPDSYDMYGVTPDGQLRNFVLDVATYGWQRSELPEPAWPEVIAIQRDEAIRIDLFGPGRGAGVVHWGWWEHGRRWFRDDPQTHPWLPGTILDEEVGPVTGGYKIVGRDQDRRPLVFWWRDPADEYGAQGSWNADVLDGQADALPSALARDRSHDSIVYFDNGVLTHWFTGRDLSTWDVARWDQPLVDEEWTTAARTRPDYLAARPEDLVLLGVSAERMDLVPGPAPVLLARADAILLLTLPPQHVGEEVTADDKPLPPGTSMRASLSGVTQLAFDVADGAAIPLDVDGLLEKIGGPDLTLRQDQTHRRGTVIEMPWHLAMTPADADLVMLHAHQPQTSADGGVALWSTRIDRRDGAPMRIDPLDVGPSDPFPMALTAAGRSVIRNLPPDDFQVSRLELSALGGTLDARADHAGFTWRHLCTLGRDQRVTTMWHGRLMPFGHRVTYTEDTERRVRLDEGEGQAPELIAALRKTRVITVTEPVVDVAGAAPFPFHRVELTTTSFGGLDEPAWTRVPRRLDIAALNERLAYLDYDLQAMGWLWTAPAPSAELRAEDYREAAAFIQVLIERHRIEQALAAGGFGADLDVTFLPVHDGSPIQFGVRASGRLGDVEFTMPLAFVVDLDLPAELGLEPFTTLGNPSVLEMARTALGSGEVGLPAVQLDLRPADAAAGGTVHEVHALNFGATSEDGTFRPTLGWPDTEDADDWAADLGLPSIRHLTGRDELARVRYPDPARRVEDVVLDIVGGLPVDLGAAAERVGALATPNFVADVISATQGPVAAAGLVRDAAGELDPASILGHGAGLLGLDLPSLINKELLGQAPTITQDPQVTYTWGPITLRPGAPLIADDSSTLEIFATAGPRASTRSTLTNVGLALPPDAPLLELHFSSLAFTQSGAEPPALDVGTVTANFRGTLQLLSELQEKVGLGSALPAITTSADGVLVSYRLPVPEVACGVFRMSNATFSAAVEIPFRPPGVRVVLGFASRESPFNVSVLAFGGGGYVRVVLNSLALGDGSAGGIEELEASLEFGASLAVNLGIARAEVHAMGGVLLQYANDEWLFTGFLRMGGSVDLLGLVSVVVELRLELTYDPEDNAMWGRATLVVELDLTLTSFDVELDSGMWVFAGGSSPDDHQALGDRGGHEAFAQYHSSVAREELA